MTPSKIELNPLLSGACHQCQLDGYCIPLHLVCDDKNHCSDNSDEINCQIKSMPPSETDSSSEISACHQCPLGYCIPLHLICDGMSQCSDQSDEKYCQFPTTTSMQPYDSDGISSHFKTMSTKSFSSNKIKGG